MFVSTRGRTPPVDLITALKSGLAPDGGLYMPAVLDTMEPELLRASPRRSLADTAARVLRALLKSDLPCALDAAVQAAFDFPIPLVPLTDRIHVLELFHGPSLAFKDVGARFLAGALMAARPDDRPQTVLTATSGDTGGAVAHAFFGLQGVRVVILFPDGQVSPVQRRQFTTLGGNVQAVGVAGSFDDCQQLVKGAFADTDLCRRIGLTSANSINVGRLLPQVVYYIHAVAQLPSDTQEIVLSVPSGNFGNLTAGLLAKRMGLPVTRFVAATNANDVVPEYLRSGRLRPRPSVRTVSNAMDVGDPSNLERILALYDGDLRRIRRDLSGRAFTDEQTMACIADTAERHGYVLDPHSAVGLLGLQAELAECGAAVGVTLATAHPAKFPDVVRRAIGRTVDVPARLACLEGRPSQAGRMEPSLDALRALLDSA